MALAILAGAALLGGFWLLGPDQRGEPNAERSDSRSVPLTPTPELARGVNDPPREETPAPRAGPALEQVHGLVVSESGHRLRGVEVAWGHRIARTDAAGSFSILGREWETPLSFRLPGYVERVLQVRPVEGRVGVDLGEVVLRGDSALRIRVVDAQGGVPGVSVDWSLASRDPSQSPHLSIGLNTWRGVGTTDARGEILARDLPGTGAILHFRLLKGRHREVATVEIGSGDVTELRLSPTGLLRVELSRPDDASAGDVSLVLSEAGGSETEHRWEDRIAVNGSAPTEIELPPGAYVVNVWCDKWPFHNVPVEVEPESTRTLVVPPFQTWSLRVHARDSRGHDLESFRVARGPDFMHGNRGWAIHSVISEPAGRSELRPWVEGTGGVAVLAGVSTPADREVAWTIACWAAGYDVGQQLLRWIPGGERTITFVMDAGPSVRGVLRDGAGVEVALALLKDGAGGTAKDLTKSWTLELDIVKADGTFRLGGCGAGEYALLWRTPLRTVVLDRFSLGSQEERAWSGTLPSGALVVRAGPGGGSVPSSLLPVAGDSRLTVEGPVLDAWSTDEAAKWTGLPQGQYLLGWRDDLVGVSSGRTSLAEAQRDTESFQVVTIETGRTSDVRWAGEVRTASRICIQTEENLVARSLWLGIVDAQAKPNLVDVPWVRVGPDRCATVHWRQGSPGTLIVAAPPAPAAGLWTVPGGLVPLHHERFSSLDEDATVSLRPATLRATNAGRTLMSIRTAQGSDWSWGGQVVMAHGPTLVPLAAGTYDLTVRRLDGGTAERQTLVIEQGRVTEFLRNGR